jgi:uncharacterized membrane protein
MRISKHLFLATPLCLAAGAVQAGLQICNETGSVQSVALGFKGETAWSSRGWWTIAPGDCATVVEGDLTKRYYYYRAEVDGGAFAGSNFMFCTSPQVFEVTGNDDCADRGYDSDSFREIDTGRTATDFTFRLMPGEHDSAPPRSAGADVPGENPDDPDALAEGLEICNGTGTSRAVAIGYDTPAGPVSEGWWILDPDVCELVLDGPLAGPDYYYRAVEEGRGFDGERSFCTQYEAFTIPGDDNCTARGYDSEAFRRIEGIGARAGFSFTVTEASVEGDAPAEEGDAGIEVCNETEEVQSIAFGYERAGGWVSEGWWNVQPGSCTLPLLDGENRRYLYYRTEVYGGEFEGENYFFCTTPEAFEILGDGECEARGYDREDFRELDTGGTEELYRLTLSPDTPRRPPSEDDRDGRPEEVLPEEPPETSPDSPPEAPAEVPDVPPADRLPPVSDTPDPGPPSFDFTVPDPDTPAPEAPAEEAPRPVVPEEEGAEDPAGEGGDAEDEEAAEDPAGETPEAEDDEDAGPPVRRGDTRVD